MVRALPALVAISLLLVAACGGDDGDDRSQIEDVTTSFFEGLTEGDCGKLAESLAQEEQIPEGQCRDFITGLEEGFAGGVSESLGGTLDEFEIAIDDVRAIDLQGSDAATATVIVHLTFGADGDLSQVFGREGADGEISGEVNIPSNFSYARQDGNWKISEAFGS